MILCLTRPGRAKAPLLTTRNGVKSARDAIALAIAAAPKGGKAARGAQEKDYAYLARLVGVAGEPTK